MRLHVEKIDCANKLAERYVKALWAVASESNVQNEVSKDMSAIHSLLSTDEAKRGLKVAAILKKVAFQMVEHANEQLKLSKPVYNLLRLLVKNDRAQLIGDICDCFNAFLHERSGRKKFYITASETYEKSDRDSIVAKIKSEFSKDAECIFVPADKGFYGVRIQHKSKILDYSAESTLSRLSAIMKE